MSNVESKPVATSIRVDHEHTLEMRADMATKTAEVENVTTGEMYTGGGGDSDFSTAEVTLTNSNLVDVSAEIPYINPGDMGFSADPAIEILTSIATGEYDNLNVPLYKGCTIARINVPRKRITVTGDIDAQEADDATGIIITGNGSIMIGGTISQFL